MNKFKVIGNTNKPILKEERNEVSSNTSFKAPHQLRVPVIRICLCIQSPNGDYNLHGYIQTKKYKVEYMGVGKHGKSYVRLYKTYDIDKDDNEYDTITVFNYQYYFKTYGIDEERNQPPARSKRK